MILLIDPTTEIVAKLDQARPDLELLHVADVGAGERALDEHPVEAIILGPTIRDDEALDAARKLHEQHPAISIVLCVMAAGPSLYRSAMRAGVADILPWKAPIDEVRDVLDRAVDATSRFQQPAGDELPTVGTTLATFATKGGCGKSFIATNLATLLAERYPGEVVLVDLDLQSGDAALMLQLSPHHGIHEAAELGDVLDDEALAGFLTPKGDLKVLAAPAHPALAEEVSGEAVTRVLGLLRTMFRWIVVDGPPAFTEHMLAAVDLIDTVIVVSSLDVPSIKNLKLSVETLKDLGVPRERMRLVLNRADSKVGLTVREVEKSLNTTIDISLPSSREVPFAVNQGIAIVSSRPKSAISKALREALQQFDRPPSGSDRTGGRSSRSSRRGA